MADTSTPAASRIFISYRREETAYAAGWLFERLADHYSRSQIFKDVDSIQLGDDFVEVISTAVGSCDILLALIGDQWLTITDAEGQARLDDPNDFVRVEIEAALARGVRVIPILVEGAQMPRAADLPPSLAKLVRRQALELSPSRFDFDTGRLLTVLDKGLADARARRVIAQREARSATEQARLGELLNKARAELRLGHFAAAIDLLTELLAIDPNHRDAAHLRDIATRERELAQIYQQAVDLETAGDWAAATNAYTEVLVLDATYRDATARRKECKLRQQVADLQGELRHHAAGRNWQAVLTVNKELTDLDPAAADPDGLATKAQQALDERKHADELARLYARAREAEDSRDWAVAVNGYAEIVRLDPHYRDAAARQDSCVHQRRISELRSRLAGHVAANDWPKVQSTVDELTALDPAVAVEYARIAKRARRKLGPHPKRRWGLIVAAVGAVVAAGVVAVVALLPSGGTASTERTVDVPATRPWTDTHVKCKDGYVLDITATGTVHHSPTSPAVDPDGDPNPGIRQFNRLTGVNHAALIGSLNGTEPLFLVGKQTTQPCQGAGDLFLGVNDGGGPSCEAGIQKCFDNNSGKFVATIKVRKAG